MLTKVTIDILPDELLYSWVSRMFRYYGYTNSRTTNIKEFNKFLFGDKSKQVPSILIPSDLNGLVKSLKLSKNSIFGSSDRIINDTSIISFYLNFIEQDKKEQVLDRIKDNVNSKNVKTLMGLGNYSIYDNMNFQMKFCPICWNVKRYFHVESQIVDNNICHLHNVILEFITIDTSKYINYNSIYNRIDTGESKKLKIKDFSLECLNSNMVHEIYINGLKDDILIIKAKIRERMRKKGFMHEKFNYIYNVNSFFIEFEKYNIYDITERDLVAICFTTIYEPSPMMYLSIIIFLFGLLSNLYSYSVEDSEISNISANIYNSHSKIEPKVIVDKRGYEHIKFILSKREDKDYIILGKDNKKYMLKHLNCRTEFELKVESIHKYKILCPKCRVKYKSEFIFKERNHKVNCIDEDYTYLYQKNSYWVLQHKKCDYEFITKPFQFMKGKRCAKCQVENKRKLIIEGINKKYKSEYEVIELGIGKQMSIFIHNDITCKGKIIRHSQNFDKLKKCPLCGKIKPIF